MNNVLLLLMTNWNKIEFFKLKNCKKLNVKNSLVISVNHQHFWMTTIMKFIRCPLWFNAGVRLRYFFKIFHTGRDIGKHTRRGRVGFKTCIPVGKFTLNDNGEIAKRRKKRIINDSSRIKTTIAYLKRSLLLLQFCVNTTGVHAAYRQRRFGENMWDSNVSPENC